MASLMPTPAHREFLPEPARVPRGKCRYCPGGPAIVQRCGGTRGGVSWRRACSIALVAVAFVCLVTFQLLGYAFFERAANHFALRLQDRRWSAPLPTGDGWRAYADHVCDEIACPIDTAPWLVRPGDVVFLKVDAATWYLTAVAPRVKARHILVMHNGDLAFTAAHARLVSALPPVRSSVSPASLPGVLPAWMDEQQRLELDGAPAPPPPPPGGQPAPPSGAATAHGLAHVYDDMPGSVAAVFAQNIDPLASLSRLYALPIGLENRPFTIGSHPAIYAHQQPQRVFGAHMKRVGPLVEAVAGACEGVRAVVNRRTAAGISGPCTSVASCVFDPVIDVHTADVAAALLDVLVRPGYNWRRRRGGSASAAGAGGGDGGTGDTTTSTSSETAAAAAAAGSSASAASSSARSTTGSGVWSDPLHAACDALLYKSTAASGAAGSNSQPGTGIPPPRALVYAAFGTGSNPRERTHAASVLASSFPWTLNAVGGMGGTVPSRDAIAGWVTVFRGLRALATAAGEGVAPADLATEEELTAARELVGQVIAALDCRVVAPAPPPQPPQGRRLSGADPVEADEEQDGDASIADGFLESIGNAASHPAARALFAGDGTTSTGTGMPVFEVPDTEEEPAPPAPEEVAAAPAAVPAPAAQEAPAEAVPPPEQPQEQPELTLSSSSGQAASVAAVVAVEEEEPAAAAAAAAAPPPPPSQEQPPSEPAGAAPLPVLDAPAPVADLEQQLRRGTTDAPARTKTRGGERQQQQQKSSRSPPRRLPSALDERIWARAKAGADTHGDYGGSGMTTTAGAAVRARAGDSNRPFSSWWAAVANAFTGNRALPGQWEGTLKANIALTTCIPFIPSPAGNGWQSHRTWEALHIGSIPLAMGTGSAAMDDVHAGLPAVVVRSWEQAGALGTLMGAWVRLHWVWRNTLASDGVAAMMQQGRAGRRYPPTRLTNGGAHEAATTAASSTSSTLRTSATGGAQLLRRRTPPNRSYQLDTSAGAWHWYAPGPPVFDPRVIGDYPWNDLASDTVPADASGSDAAVAAGQPQPEQQAAPAQQQQQPDAPGDGQRRRKRTPKGDGGVGDDDDDGDLFSLVAEPVVERSPQSAPAAAARAASGGAAPAPPLPRLSPEQQRFRGDVWLTHQHRSVFAPERLFLGHWLAIVDKLRYQLQADDGVAA